MKAPRVTLDQWRTLQAVVDQGGFAQAAEVLHRSQSSVSYTVARMQEQLGVPLLRIDGRKAVLTEAGDVLLRRSRQLVKQASQLVAIAVAVHQPSPQHHVPSTFSIYISLFCRVPQPIQKM